MVNLLKYWGKRMFLGYAIVLYLIVLLLLSVMQRDKVPDLPIVYMQLSALPLIFLYSWSYSKKSIGITLCLVFSFVVIMSFGMRYFFNEYFNNPLGAMAFDSAFYNRIAANHMYQSYHEFYRYLVFHDQDYDDMGFLFIAFSVYKLSGSPELGIQLMLWFNALAITITSYYVYKFSIYFSNQRLAMFATFLWGIELYSIYTAATGLKENFMTMFVTMSLYYIVLTYNRISIKNVVCALLFATAVLFFRLPIFFMLILCFLYAISFKLPLVKRYFYAFAIFLSILASIYYYQTVDQLAVMRGYSYEVLEQLAKDRTEAHGFLTEMVKYLSAVIGPFPNLVAATLEKQNYITLYSFSSFCKVFYSFFMIYGGFKAIKNKNYPLTILMLFWFFNSVMLIFTMFTMHDRYQWPHMPLTIVLACYGLVEWKNARHLLKWSQLYFWAALGMIVVFNFR